MQHQRYQAVMNCHDNSVVYLELLTKFINNEDEVIPADVEIAKMEDNSDIINFDLNNLKLVLRTSSSSTDTIGVNISPKTINSQKLTDILLLAKKENSKLLSQSNIVFEITEYSKLTITDKTLLNLELIKSLNIMIAADDFGNGYMGKDAINVIKPQYIKIRLDDINANIADIIEYSIDNDFKVIIENISCEEEYNQALEFTPFALQGFYIDTLVSKEK